MVGRSQESGEGSGVIAMAVKSAKELTVYLKAYQLAMRVFEEIFNQGKFEVADQIYAPDFKNHVVHPRDGYWGGAPAKAQSWFDNLVEAMAKGDWETVAYCAGVLSHYCVDPIHPFHTAQSEAENNIHRACEWSISKSYDDLKRIGERDFPNPVIAVPTGANWLSLLICQGADRSNKDYEKLIAHYDITRGVTEPTSGLDDIGRRLVAELIIYAAEMFAIVLERAIAASGATPPEVSLTAEAFLATASIPVKWITQRMADAGERRQVEAMYDELRKTGRVEATLPADDRAVRDLHVKEIATRHVKTPAAQVFPFRRREKVVARLDKAGPGNGEAMAAERGSAEIVSMKARLAVPPPRPAPPRTETPPIRRRDFKQGIADAADVVEPAQNNEAAPAAAMEPAAHTGNQTAATANAATPPSMLHEIVSVGREYHDRLTSLRSLTNGVAAVEPPHVKQPPARPAVTSLTAALVNAPIDIATRRPHREPARPHAAADVVSAPPASPHETAGDRAAQSRRASKPEKSEKAAGTPRIHLVGSQDVVDAPSIGPKTAERLYAVGIDTVDEFLKAHPIALAARLEVKHITADVITDWQDQTKLVCAIPGLRGTQAQLLVGAGYRTADAVAKVDADKLCADILNFATSKDGQRILRDGNPPDVEKIKSWVENARAVHAA